MKPRKLFGKQWIFDGFLPGAKLSSTQGFAVDREIFHTRTSYQDLFIFENEEYGRILMLNGLVQLAEVGEEVYHEMLVHPALMLFENLEKVMIIGGGDGGALREVLKHPVKEVIMAEIDEGVIDASKKYLPSLSKGAFEDNRVTLVIEDAANVLLRYENYFDCIIMDSNDPDGEMAEGLFSQPFFLKVKNALKKSGIFAAQTGCFSDTFRKDAQAQMQKVFPAMWVHRALVRYYPSDEHSFSFASSQKSLAKVSFMKLRERFEKRHLATMYYSPEMHGASSVLPARLRKEAEKESSKAFSWISFLYSVGTKLKSASRS